MSSALKLGFSLSLSVHIVAAVATAIGFKSWTELHSEDVETDSVVTLVAIEDLPTGVEELTDVRPPIPQLSATAANAPDSPATFQEPLARPLDLTLVKKEEPVNLEKSSVLELPPAADPELSAVSAGSREPSAPASSASLRPSGRNALETATQSSSKGNGTTVVAHPAYKTSHLPSYPLTARRRGEEGTVLLHVWVNAHGRVDNVQIKESSGFSLLDEAALKTLRSWEFEPGRSNTVPVACEVEVPVRFKIAQ